MSNNEQKKESQQFVFIPIEQFDTFQKNHTEILRNQIEILDLLKGNLTSSNQFNIVTEKEAIKILGKKATWFWLKRKSGELKYTKVGAKVFYSLDELKKLVGQV